MKYSIGYQLPDPYDSMAELSEDFREHIASVYFSLPGHASARSAVEPQAQDCMLEELSFIHSLGIPLVLLYNANCYGDHAISPVFESEILHSVADLAEKLDLADITTTSPFVARVIKKHFPQIQVTASVNMWIGTQQAMEYLGDDFDGFYLQREYNRDFKKIRSLTDWCRRHGKHLRLLANSGCLYTCPFHSFHDNLVAHEAQASQLGNAMGKYPSPCWDRMYRLSTEQAAATFLQESWIRPQDIVHYEPYFDQMKLATRMHSNPRRVLNAYVRGRYTGNFLDLTEPSYSRRFDRHILDATRFPDDWFQRTTTCSKNCEECGYCLKTAKHMLVSKRELERMYLSDSL